MNNRDGGGPAYPVNTTNDGTPGSAYCSEGMTMRQRYKIAALPLAMDDAIDSFEDNEAMARKIAHTAGLIANAMLAEDEVHEREGITNE